MKTGSVLFFAFVVVVVPRGCEGKDVTKNMLPNFNIIRKNELANFNETTEPAEIVKLYKKEGQKCTQNGLEKIPKSDKTSSYYVINYCQEGADSAPGKDVIVKDSFDHWLQYADLYFYPGEDKAVGYCSAKMKTGKTLAFNNPFLNIMRTNSTKVYCGYDTIKKIGFVVCVFQDKADSYVLSKIAGDVFYDNTKFCEIADALERRTPPSEFKTCNEAVCGGNHIYTEPPPIEESEEEGGNGVERRVEKGKKRVKKGEIKVEKIKERTPPRIQLRTSHAFIS